MLTTDDFMWYVDEALDAMVGIVTELGDDLANRRPDLPGANSTYALLTHCLGVMAWWSGHVVMGRDVPRDRSAEFTATGPVAELAARAAEVRDRFAADVAAHDPDAQPARLPGGPDDELPLARRQGTTLMHVYEELAQHRGHMDITRDLVLQAATG